MSDQYANDLAAIEKALNDSDRERVLSSSVKVGTFDNPGACVRVLEDTAREIAGFEYEWANAAGALEDAIRALESADADALLHLEQAAKAFRESEGEDPRTGSKEDREALARWYADLTYPGLRRTVSRLKGSVERAKARHKALDRIADNAQSALASHRENMKGEAFLAG